MRTVNRARLWAGQAINPLQRVGGIWLESLGCDLRPEDSAIARRHIHTSCVCYLREGTGNFRIDRQSFAVSAGHLVWYPADSVVTQKPDTDGPWELYWVAVNGPLVEGLAEEFGWSPERMPIQLGSDSSFIPLFDEMLETIFIEPYGRYLVNGLAYQFLAHLGQHILGMQDKPLSSASASITEIIAFMGRHLHEPLKLDDIAAHFYLSRSHFVRVFNTATGIAPMQYLTQLRIDRARALLFTDRPVSEIAPLVGIQDVNYFFRVFKRLTGLTPQQYRDQYVKSPRA